MEADMKDVELNELEPEKQPMTPASPGSPEKNGAVKVKVAEDEEDEGAPKFTGLSKEELLRAAGTPGWVRARWALLILFWLGWLGMLAGAVLIIVQAPRCRPLPPQTWWHKGGLYRIQPVKAFRDSKGGNAGDLAGVKEKLDYVAALGVQGLVLAPLHDTKRDSPEDTDLQKLHPELGSNETLAQLLEAAKKKGLKVILDLTPNYQGQQRWFGPGVANSTRFHKQFKVGGQGPGPVEAAVSQGLFGPLGWGMGELGGTWGGGFWGMGPCISFLFSPPQDPQFVADLHNITQEASANGNARVFVVGIEEKDPGRILVWLNETSADLLVSPYLEELGPEPTGEKLAETVSNYIKAAGAAWPAWSGGSWHLADLLAERLLPLYHLLLFTLPGTPLLRYGDEIGLRHFANKVDPPQMPWDDRAPGPAPSSAPTLAPSLNSTVQEQMLQLLRELSELRGKERSLLHGDLDSVLLTSGAWGYLRRWDQSARFLVLLNPGEARASATPRDPLQLQLLTAGTVELSTCPQRPRGDQLSLSELMLAPGEGLLLRIPYQA
ncbi:4F2 cell-surface antigen heavy chain [Alligator sinensis]|uniref:4F2 cell-surface antigen heavy chain n=1 Tax=Alligator sinensis TaxID=38654 RepID=A0A3Q0FTK3_ALLSI|nr:4F2 cell-surface antigen heavy chain [Alligator sinensis]